MQPLRRTVAAVLLGILAAGRAQGQVLASDVGLPRLTTLGGAFHGAAAEGGVLIGFGPFERVGRRVEAFGTVAAADGAPVRTPRFVADGAFLAGGMDTGSVLALVPDGTGGWFVGGDFTTIAGLTRPGLVRVKPDGSLYPNFDAGLANAAGPVVVRALAVASGKVFVGGEFTSVGGAPRTGLAAVAPSTGAVQAWAASLGPRGGGGAGADPRTTCLVAANGALFVGGRFGSVGGVVREGLARVNVSTAAVHAWNPGAVDGTPLALAVDAAGLYVGGSFAGVGAAARTNLAVIDRTTAAVGVWAPDPAGGAGAVRALAAAAGKVVVGGSFTTIAGVPRDGLAIFDAPTAGSPASTPTGATPATGDVAALAVLGTTCFVGVGAAFDLGSGLPLAWNPAPDVGATALAAAGGEVAIGGVHALDVRARHDVVGVDATTWRPLPWSHDLRAAGAGAAVAGSGSVADAALAGGSLFVAGDFVSADGATRTHLATFDAGTGALDSWDPAPDGPTTSLLLAEGRLYVAGSFTTFDGAPRAGLACVDVATRALLPWAPVVSRTGGMPEVRLAFRSGRVWLCGVFDAVNGDARRNLAATDAITGATTAFDAQILDGTTVRAVAFGDQGVFVRGDFTAIGGATRVGLAELNAATGVATTWNPGLTGAGGAPGLEERLVVLASEVVAGGSFTGGGGIGGASFLEVDRLSGLATGVPASGPPFEAPGSPAFPLASGLVCVGAELRRLPITRPAASVIPFGAGCCGAILSKSPTLVGEDVPWEIHGAPPFAAGGLFYGFPVATPVDAGGGNLLYLDLAQLIVPGQTFVTDANGYTTESVYAAPLLSIWGLSFREQGVMFGGPFGLVFTNAVDQVMGY